MEQLYLFPAGKGGEAGEKEADEEEGWEEAQVISQ